MRRSRVGPWRGTLVGVLLGTALGCRTVPSPEADRAAIIAVLDRQAGAWNRGDLDAFMEGYWRSPDLVYTSGGRLRRGYAAITESYRGAYRDRAAMGKLSFDELEVHLLRPDAAWVLGRWQVATTPADGSPTVVGGVFTLVFHRFGDHWRIVHDHTSELKQPEK
jgi:beta-aspartyl-peptidase (threonine type)